MDRRNVLAPASEYPLACGLICSSMFSTSSETWSLQFYLYDMVNSTLAMRQMAQNVNINTAELPTQTVKLAMAVVATGPVLLFYPFVQRYFVKGITIGAVKG